MKKLETTTKPCGCVVGVYVTSIICDCCKKEYADGMDIQEFIHIQDTGGYNSAIGDCVEYECDLCSECVNRLLGKYLQFPASTR